MLASVMPMPPVNRRSTLVFGAALALVACSPSDTSSVPAPLEDSDCPPELAAKVAAWEAENRAVEAWVEQNRGSIPADYDELSRLPTAYRLAGAQTLSPVQVSALVQEHLRRCVAARPEMTDEQRGAIAFASEVFTPAWYDGGYEARAAAWQGELGERIDKVFSLPETIRIFHTIGPEDEGLRAKIADAVAPPEM